MDRSYLRFMHMCLKQMQNNKICIWNALFYVCAGKFIIFLFFFAPHIIMNASWNEAIFSNKSFFPINPTNGSTFQWIMVSHELTDRIAQRDANNVYLVSPLLLSISNFTILLILFVMFEGPSNAVHPRSSFVNFFLSISHALRFLEWNLVILGSSSSNCCWKVLRSITSMLREFVVTRNTNCAPFASQNRRNL